MQLLRIRTICKSRILNKAKKEMKNILFAFLLSGFSLTFSEEDFAALQNKLDSEPNNTDILLKLGIGYHNRGVKGDKEAVEKSDEYLSRLIRIDKTNYLALAYLGSVNTLQGNNAFLFWEKLKLAKKGIEKIDRAVESDSSNMEIRLLRAMNSLSLPSFLNRIEKSIQDFSYIETSGEFAQWPVDDQAMVFYNSGLAFERNDKKNKAEEQFQRAIEIAPKSRWAESAQKEMPGGKGEKE